MGFVYQINFPSGKSYIGQTIRPIEKRIKQHLRQNGCILVSKALKKYEGEYTVEILLEEQDELLSTIEMECIAYYNTVSPNGYNLTHGGEGGIPSEETRKKMSLSGKGKIISQKTREKLAIGNRGQRRSEESKKNIREGLKNSEYKGWRKKIAISKIGKPHTEETKQKMSNSRLNWLKDNKVILSQEAKEKISKTKKSKKPGEAKDLPLHIVRINNKKGIGYVVKVPGKKQKWFTSSSIPDEEKKAKAIQYLNDMKNVQRLNI